MRITSLRHLTSYLGVLDRSLSATADDVSLDESERLWHPSSAVLLLLALCVQMPLKSGLVTFMLYLHLVHRGWPTSAGRVLWPWIWEQRPEYCAPNLFDSAARLHPGNVDV